MYDRDNLAYIIAIVCGFGLVFVWKYSDRFPFIALVVLFASLFGGYWAASELYTLFKARDRIIRFKQNINPLFIRSEWAGHESSDPEVLAARDYALESLLLAGRFGVKVYTIFYRDPVYSIHWWEEHATQPGQGVLKFDTRERDGIVVDETWDEFLDFVTEFQTKKIDDNLREIYRRNKSREGVEAVQKFIHRQN